MMLNSLSENEIIHPENREGVVTKDSSISQMEIKASISDQICFTGDSSCPKFTGHFLKPNMCTNCMKEISKHAREAIKNEECVLKALEHTQKGLMVPTKILERTPTEGALFIGGFKAAINSSLLKEENITHIVNVAGKALGMMFGPKYREISKEVKETLNITMCDLDWEDTMKYNIEDEDFCHVIEFVDNARKHGSVLVHCAQGKSRSGTAVCAYLMAKENMDMLQAIEFIQSKRKMVDPNPNFRHRLIKFEKSNTIKTLREKLRQ